MPTHITDIHIVNKFTNLAIWDDWLFNEHGFLDETEVLANVVKVALLTNRRADMSEILPDPDSDNREGWWGDFDAEVIWEGWPIGCRNWLLGRAKIIGPGTSEGATVIRAEEYTRNALQPLIDKRICTAIEVVAERVKIQGTSSQIHRIDVNVTVFRGPRAEVELQFQDLWSEIREA